MKHRYHPELTKEHYDAIVVGSGLGGLTTAVLLAKNGKKVLVLERHYEIGGFTHMFKRKNYAWDVGVHYVGEVHSKDKILRKIFDYVSEDGIQWADMGEVYDRVIIEGDVYDFRKGATNHLEQLIAYFPEDENAIRTYFSLLKKVSHKATIFFSERCMPPWLSKSIGYFMRKGLYPFSDKTTDEVLRSLTTNEKLIAVLCAQCGNYGLPPKRSSFAIHAMIVDHFLNGGSYPVGGAASIHENLTRVLEKNGGKVAIKADVKEILFKKNKAIGIELKNGDKLFADRIISNSGVDNTFSSLIPEGSKKKEYNDLLKDTDPSVSHVCLYVGINASDAELGLPKHNIWIYDGYDMDKRFEEHLNTEGSFSPLAYISFPSAKDPLWHEKHGNTATIQVIGSYPYHWLKKWENEQWQKRGADYEEIKEGIKNNLLERLYTAMPQVKGRVELAELSTPLSTAHFSNYKHGEIYGLEHTPARFRQYLLRPHTSYKNLFITGQDIVCVGVGSALFSGVLSAVAILTPLVMLKMFRKKS